MGQECPQLHLKVPPVPVDDMVNIISMAVWKRMKDVSDAGGTVSGRDFLVHHDLREGGPSEYTGE